MVCVGLDTCNSSGTMEVTTDKPTESYALAAIVDSPFGDGSFQFGAIKCPVETYYFAGNPIDIPRVANISSLNIAVRQGTYNFQVTGTVDTSIGSLRPYFCAGWDTSASYPPYFGMQIAQQKDDHYPYGYGSTNAALGCCACSLFAISQSLGCHPQWTLHEFFNQLKLHHGIDSENYLSMPIAAKLLGMRLIKATTFSDTNLAKYLGQGYGIAVKVHRPGRKKNKFHWVAATPGVTLTPHPKWGMMDPQRQFNYFDEATFTPKEIRILANKWDYYFTQNGWWNNSEIMKEEGFPAFFVNWLWIRTRGGRGLASPITLDAKQSKSVLALNTSPVRIQSSSLATDMFPLSELSITSSKNVKITKVIAPDFIIPNGTSTDRYSLTDIISEYIDDDSIEDPPVVPDEPDPTPDRTEFSCDRATPGSYIFELSGEPLSTYHLTTLITDMCGNWIDGEISGVLDSAGKAIVTIVHDPGTMIDNLSDIRKLAVGAKVVINSKLITYIDRNNNEFFCQNNNRIGGIRVTVDNAKLLPKEWEYFTDITGNIISISPEITIAATSVAMGMSTKSVELVEDKPIGMPTAKWPEMANCILFKIWGKVISVDGTTAVINNGSGEVTVKNLDIPVIVGNQLSLNAVLRSNHEVKAIAGTAQIVN
jgi:hypothetical protein